MDRPLEGGCVLESHLVPRPRCSPRKADLAGVTLEIESHAATATPGPGDRCLAA